MVMVDQMSKCTHVVLTTADVTASGVAQSFRHHVSKIHGLPEEAISDQGTQFESKFTYRPSQLLGIRITVSMAYHLKTNGMTKQVNYEVKQFLRLFVDQCQDNWYEWLAISKFAYNN